MKTTRKNPNRNLSLGNLVDIYFERIVERQLLEEKYYSTEKAALLPEIR